MLPAIVDLLNNYRDYLKQQERWTFTEEAQYLLHKKKGNLRDFLIHYMRNPDLHDDDVVDSFDYFRFQKLRRTPENLFFFQIFLIILFFPLSIPILLLWSRFSKIRKTWKFWKTTSECFVDLLYQALPPTPKESSDTPRKKLSMRSEKLASQPPLPLSPYRIQDSDTYEITLPSAQQPVTKKEIPEQPQACAATSSNCDVSSFQSHEEAIRRELTYRHDANRSFHFSYQHDTPSLTEPAKLEYIAAPESTLPGVFRLRLHYKFPQTAAVELPKLVYGLPLEVIQEKNPESDLSAPLQRIFTIDFFEALPFIRPVYQDVPFSPRIPMLAITAPPPRTQSSSFQFIKARLSSFFSCLKPPKPAEPRPRLSFGETMKILQRRGASDTKLLQALGDATTPQEIVDVLERLVENMARDNAFWKRDRFIGDGFKEGTIKFGLKMIHTWVNQLPENYEKLSATVHIMEMRLRHFSKLLQRKSFEAAKYYYEDHLETLPFFIEYACPSLLVWRDHLLKVLQLADPSTYRKAGDYSNFNRFISWFQEKFISDYPSLAVYFDQHTIQPLTKLEIENFCFHRRLVHLNQGVILRTQENTSEKKEEARKEQKDQYDPTTAFPLLPAHLKQLNPMACSSASAETEYPYPETIFSYADDLQRRKEEEPFLIQLEKQFYSSASYSNYSYPSFACLFQAIFNQEDSSITSLLTRYEKSFIQTVVDLPSLHPQFNERKEAAIRFLEIRLFFIKLHQKFPTVFHTSTHIDNYKKWISALQNQEDKSLLQLIHTHGNEFLASLHSCPDYFSVATWLKEAAQNWIASDFLAQIKIHCGLEFHDFQFFIQDLTDKTQDENLSVFIQKMGSAKASRLCALIYKFPELHPDKEKLERIKVKLKQFLLVSELNKFFKASPDYLQECTTPAKKDDSLSQSYTPNQQTLPLMSLIHKVNLLPKPYPGKEEVDASTLETKYDFIKRRLVCELNKLLGTNLKYLYECIPMLKEKDEKLLIKLCANHDAVENWIFSLSQIKFSDKKIKSMIGKLREDRFLFSLKKEFQLDYASISDFLSDVYDLKEEIKAVARQDRGHALYKKLEELKASAISLGDADYADYIERACKQLMKPILLYEFKRDFDLDMRSLDSCFCIALIEEEGKDIRALVFEKNRGEAFLKWLRSIPLTADDYYISPKRLNEIYEEAEERLLLFNLNKEFSFNFESIQAWLRALSSLDARIIPLLKNKEKLLKLIDYFEKIPERHSTEDYIQTLQEYASLYDLNNEFEMEFKGSLREALLEIIARLTQPELGPVNKFSIITHRSLLHWLADLKPGLPDTWRITWKYKIQDLAEKLMDFRGRKDSHGQTPEDILKKNNDPYGVLDLFYKIDDQKNRFKQGYIPHTPLPMKMRS